MASRGTEVGASGRAGAGEGSSVGLSLRGSQSGGCSSGCGARCTCKRQRESAGSRQQQSARRREGESERAREAKCPNLERCLGPESLCPLSLPRVYVRDCDSLLLTHLGAHTLTAPPAEPSSPLPRTAVLSLVRNRVCTPPVRPRRAMHTSHSPVLQALPTLTHNSRASPFRALDPPCPSPPSSSSRGASAGRVPQPRGRCLPQRQGRRPGALPVSSRAGPGSASATAHRPALDRARAQRQSRTQWITCTATSSSLTHLSLSCCIGSLAVDRCAPARYCLPLDPCPRLGATSPPPRRQLRGAARTQAPVALARALSHPLLLRSSALLLRAWKDTPSD